MDMTQAMQTLKWLDEERRKDRATISALQERVQEQERQLAQQSAQTQELQTALAGVQGVLSQVNEFEQVISNYKAELIFRMDRLEDVRRKEQTEAERLRRIEYEAVVSHLNRLERELRVLPRYDEELSTRQAEEQRLSETLQRLEVTVAELDKRSDDRVQTVAFLEEQRRADNRRIAELEQDATDLRKKSEVLTKKFPLLEEMLQKQRPRIEEAIQETKKYAKPIEELRISDFQREQKMQQYLDQGEEVVQELERIRAQTQGFIEQQQLVKRSLSALEKFKGRIERRQDEMAERQRIAEEHVERRWKEWQTARLKARKKQAVIVEERRRQQEQTNDEHLKRLNALRSAAELYRAQLDALWEGRRAEATSLLKAVQDVHETLVAPVDEHLETLRREQ
jgi:chromosome segregation ATPase